MPRPSIQPPGTQNYRPTRNVADRRELNQKTGMPASRHCTASGRRFELASSAGLILANSRQPTFSISVELLRGISFLAADGSRIADSETASG